MQVSYLSGNEAGHLLSRLYIICNILRRMINPSQLPSFSDTQAEAETKRKNEHYDWFILLLVLPTVSI